MPYPSWNYNWANGMGPNGYLLQAQPQPQPYANMPTYSHTTVPGQQSNFTNIIRVTGLEGAKAYPLGPNSSVVMFDEQVNEMYIKTTDGAGFPTIHPYIYNQKLEKIEAASEAIDVKPADEPSGVAKSEYEQFCSQMQMQMDELRSMLVEMKRGAENGSEHIQSGNHTAARIAQPAIQ